MIDFHSHILPCVDDGSKSLEESRALLGMLASQGVETIVSTSHFYPDHEPPKSFLKRRDESYEKLCDSLGENKPEILLGAEVKFYDGISRMEELPLLRIANTKLLLLEMPFSHWTKYTLNELRELSCLDETVIVLAHIERYLNMQERGLLDFLRSNGILIQVNASFFTNILTRRKAFKLLEAGMIDFIGSDCHNLKYRPPLIGEACGVIKNKFGEEFLLGFTEYTKELLETNILK